MTFMNQVYYCIRSNKETDDNGDLLYWNNQYGWVNQSEVELFSEEERHTFSLPNNSNWEMYENGF